mgnify:CR=1 FL=1
MGRMRKSRLSIYKQDRLIEHFVSSSTARTAASLCGVNRKTAAFFFLRLREIIAHELEAESEAMFDGEIEVDESYFGGRRKGKRGRGAAGKIPVFGLLKRGGRVYTKIIPDASGATLIPIIKRKVIPDSILYSDSWPGYNVLDVSVAKLTAWNLCHSRQDIHTLHVPEVQKVDEYPVLGELVPVAAVHINHAHITRGFTCRHAHKPAGRG